MLALMWFSGASIGGSAIEWSFAQKLLWPSQLMSAYNLLLSIFCLAALICVWLVLRFKDALVFLAPGKWIMAGYLLLYLIVPWRLFDSAYVEIRLMVAAILFLPACVSFVPKKNWQFYLAASGLSLDSDCPHEQCLLRMACISARVREDEIVLRTYTAKITYIDRRQLERGKRERRSDVFCSDASRVLRWGSRAIVLYHASYTECEVKARISAFRSY